MNNTDTRKRNLTPAGYAALIEQFQLDTIPNWHESFIGVDNSHSTEMIANTLCEIYPVNYRYKNTLCGHLEFAIKNDGVNLAILAAIFRVAPLEEFTVYIASNLHDKYARRLWFWFEFLTGEKLAIDDLAKVDYFPLLEPDNYYVISNPQQNRRQCIYDNMLGNSQFCPVVRKTNCLRKFENANFAERCKIIVSKIPAELLQRGTNYLYAKETKSSFGIEHIQPKQKRIEQFIRLLKLSEKDDFCTKNKLIDLQNLVVDSQFCDTDFRRRQNYVGESISWTREKIHFIAPKPENLVELMDGFFVAHNRMSDGGVSPVIHAAVISYGLVFLHPFEDGNGRIHRFLIHNILARSGFTPSQLIFPVSATMLKNHADYDASLEAFSIPLTEIIDYTLNPNGQMTVQNETINFYKYIDMTTQAEWLFRFIERTIETEFVAELDFLDNYDLAKKSISEFINIPDKKIDLIIQSCIQNNGSISLRKRNKIFDFLTDNEIKKIEKIIQSTFKKQLTKNRIIQS
ncbi:MAG: Fic family protein [Planctomycetaceae bacterium]|jgi:hypothetical protein|nr:Fic family protein [Planctomycetaceae bacterium]